MAHDNCDGCSKDYDFEKGRDTIHIYLKNTECDHVQAQCPHCGRTTRIFLVPESIIGLMEELHLGLRVYAETPKDLIESARKLWEMAEETGEASDGEDNSAYGEVKNHADPYADLPQPPRDWLIQLHDELRHFDHDCGDPSCPGRG